ncbi:MAG TPA: hypothetical protein V6C99_09955 [Oculatellaceae cyanobacterium]|jgi:hypothetical protein
MTELEMSLTLGLLSEPEKNFVRMDTILQTEIMYLKHIFQISKHQRDELGNLNPDLWAELLPWHSLN